MNDVQRAERDILLALVIEANRPSGDMPDLADLKARYNIEISDVLLPTSIRRWETAGFLMVARSKDGIAVRVKPEDYGQALSSLLDLISANTFEVSWSKEEIVTDAVMDSSYPGINGWKIFEIEKAQPALASEVGSDAGTPPIHVHNVFSPTNHQTVNVGANAQEDRSFNTAGWLGAWGTWVGVAISIVAIFVALHLAGRL